MKYLYSQYSIFEDSFQVRLLGGKTSNVGRVTVQYDGMWFDVCFESKKSGQRQWRFSNVQVMCRELGFPGAMFARQGGQGTGTHQSIVAGYVCKEGMNPSITLDEPNQKQNKTKQTNKKTNKETNKEKQQKHNKTIQKQNKITQKTA